MVMGFVGTFQLCLLLLCFELENQIGMYVNTLPIKTSINGNTRFSSFLLNEKEVILESFNHQNIPFDFLIENLDLKRDLSRSPLFDVITE